MASATNGGTTATYTYNALGQRIRRATSSATTLYAYDEAGHLAGEYTAAGALVQETVWLGDIPVATLRPNGAGGVDLFYVHADHLNTPRLITDTANNIRWRWDSDPFGTTPPNQNPSGLGTFEYSLRFPGQQYDAVVGLNYNYFRDYDPAVGRYVESDPIGIDGGSFSTYVFLSGNPLMRIDTLGLADCLNSCRQKCIAAFDAEVKGNYEAYARAFQDCRLENFKKGMVGKDAVNCQMAEWAILEAENYNARRRRDKCLAGCADECADSEKPCQRKRPLDKPGKPGAGGVR